MTVIHLHRGVCNHSTQVLNNFNNFWYTHHLFAAFYILLLIHPTPGLPDESKEWGVSDFWLWGGIPINQVYF